MQSKNSNRRAGLIDSLTDRQYFISTYAPLFLPRILAKLDGIERSELTQSRFNRRAIDKNASIFWTSIVNNKNIK
jgi:hypothetical protein